MGRISIQNTTYNWYNIVKIIKLKYLLVKYFGKIIMHLWSSILNTYILYIYITSFINIDIDIAINKIFFILEDIADYTMILDSERSEDLSILYLYIIVAMLWNNQWDLSSTIIQ